METERHREDSQVKMEAEMGVTWLATQTTKRCWEVSEAGNRQGRSLPKNFPRARGSASTVTGRSSLPS